jgi:hypothetical protein
MKDCQCFIGQKCDGLPNRFRKILDEKEFWLDSKDFDCKQATKNCDAAIKAEFGETYESAWCQNMQPVIHTITLS